MERVILVFALVLGIAVDAFFAIVNFYPVAPPRSAGPRRYIVATMDPAHADWFQTNVVDEFNRAHNVDLRVRAATDDDVLATMRQARAGTGRRDVVLVAMPGALTRRLVHDGSVRAFDSVRPAAAIARDLAALPASVRDAGRLGGHQYFLPRSTVLDLAVYRPSKVRDAVLNWPRLQPAIDAALRRVNGRGLPDGYELERSPADWDTYDQFVIGYYWAHRSYAGRPPRPRLAHRSDPGIAGEVYLLSAMYRAGVTDATVRQPAPAAAVDFLAWESLFRAEGLYVDAMVGPGGLDAEGILGGFRAGRIFLAPLDETEAFRLHGGSRREAVAQVDEADDLAFYAMPRGASLALDASGRPAHIAGGFSFREDSVWALPANGPVPDLAYEFVQFAWGRDTHVRECEAIGVLPLRDDVVRERASIFRLDWEQEVFEGAHSQWPRAEVVPAALIDDGIARRFGAHWRALMARAASGPVPPAAIAAALRSPGSPPAPAPAPTTPVPSSNDEGRDDLEPWRSEVVLVTPDAGTDASR